ncbi:MAG: hypothetical protein NZ958_03525 [Bacteroidia bacterium]|nr:hypothetical protein [Bacteroidia bacterium]MDW8088289.1 hypothetical protein [Bacteroidia bacterium]
MGRYLGAWVAVMAVRLLYYAILPHLYKGMGLQLMPSLTAVRYGFRTLAADTAAPHIPAFLPYQPYYFQQLGYWNPDAPSYFYPFLQAQRCLSRSGELSCLQHICAYYRTPGYGIWGLAYLPLARWLSIQEVLILLQLFLGGLAALAFGDTVERLTGNPRLFWLGALSYGSFPFIVRYEFVMGSEGLFHSFLTGALWAFARSGGVSHRWLVLAGLLLTEAILIRPIGVALLPVVVGWVAWASRSVSRVLLTLAPLLVFEVFWLPCTWRAYGRPTPLQPTIWTPGIDSTEWRRTFEWLDAFGEMPVHFFYSRYKLPERAYTTAFGPSAEKTLIALRHTLARGDSSAILPIARLTGAWRTSLRQEKPFLYFGLRFLYLTWHFFTCHWAEQLIYTPIWTTGIYGLLYGYSALLWGFWVIGGLIGSGFYLWRWRQAPFLAAVALGAHLAWLGHLWAGTLQSRYFLFPLIPFGLLAFCWTERTFGREKCVYLTHVR